VHLCALCGCHVAQQRKRSVCCISSCCSLRKCPLESFMDRTPDTNPLRLTLCAASPSVAREQAHTASRCDAVYSGTSPTFRRNIPLSSSGLKKEGKRHAACLLLTCHIFFDDEHGGGPFLRNVGELPLNSQVPRPINNASIDVLAFR
jgi:hypothetical protein